MFDDHYKLYISYNYYTIYIMFDFKKSGKDIFK